MALSRDAIFGLPVDIETEEVQVPEWGGSVFIRGMSGAERDAFEAASRRRGEVDLRNYRARFLVRVIVNENGTQIFADADAAELGKRSSKVINRLFDVASRLSGMGEEEVEDVEGNSGTAPTTAGADSSSASPVTLVG